MTHGRGKKAGRGAGLRGGRGNAGLLKHRYMYMVKNMPDHFGRHGFKRPQSVLKKDRIINVGQLEEKFSGKKEINLGKEGFDKLLGGGTVKTKMKIKVDNASEKAVEKIKKAGGEVVMPEKPVVEKVVVKEEVEPAGEPEMVEEESAEEDAPAKEPAEEKPSKEEISKDKK
jgi:large subunit ribosomal protein L15